MPAAEATTDQEQFVLADTAAVALADPPVIGDIFGAGKLVAEAVTAATVANIKAADTFIECEPPAGGGQTPNTVEKKLLSGVTKRRAGTPGRDDATVSVLLDRAVKGGHHKDLMDAAAGSAMSITTIFQSAVGDVSVRVLNGTKGSGAPALALDDFGMFELAMVVEDETWVDAA